MELSIVIGALRQATRDVCMYCAGRAVGWCAAQGPNGAGNWTHVHKDRRSDEILCPASSIHARIRIEEARCAHD